MEEAEEVEVSRREGAGGGGFVGMDPGGYAGGGSGAFGGGKAGAAQDPLNFLKKPVVMIRLSALVSRKNS